MSYVHHIADQVLSLQDFIFGLPVVQNPLCDTFRPLYVIINCLQTENDVLQTYNVRSTGTVCVLDSDIYYIFCDLHYNYNKCKCNFLVLNSFFGIIFVMNNTHFILKLDTLCSLTINRTNKFHN